ncbi:MAG TPA: branched-chain amino acid transaminase [Planctomycetota bacterium]|nr:branched-chain amino acid transaminase [Planctomycetota bacterium]
MPDGASVLWLDGKLVPIEQATLPILSHALHYGFGVFEGIRAYRQVGGGGAVFRLDTHLRRLVESAKILKLELPFSYEEMFEGCKNVLRANALEEAYLRPIAWLGEGRMGVGAFDNKVHVAVAAWVWGAYLGDEALTKGIRAKISSFLRPHPNVAMVRGKVTGQYVNSVLAKREAYDLGYDEAILLDHSGFVAEGSGENIFIVRGDRILTPSLAAPILRGVTRDSVIDLAREMGFEVAEHSFHRDTLYVADEAFFTGTAAEITPIREVDDRTIGTGAPGPVTKRLQAAFREAVTGRNRSRAAWLAPIGRVASAESVVARPTPARAAARRRA